MTGSRRSAVFSVVVIALTGAMLLLAGTTPREIGRAVDAPSRVQLDNRTFSCAGGISGAEAVSGNLTSGLAPAQPLASGAGTPRTLVAGREVAAGAFAGQQVATRGTLAWAPCPEPGARWWFVGAGGAENTHGTVLTIANPRPGEAVVDIEVFGPQGLVEAPAFRDIAIPPGGTKVIDLARTAPAIGNLAVSVTAKRGLVAVSAADRFAPGTVGSFAREWLPPQSLPAPVVTLAGLPLSRGTSSLIIANPNDVEAIVKVEVIGQTGTFVPEGLDDFIVAPGTVRTVPLGSVVDGTPLAIKVSSEQRVTATVRSVREGDTAFATGVRVLRGATAFAVPEGSARLLVSSLRDGSDLRVVAYSRTGAALLDKTVAVGAQTTQAVVLPAGTRYVRLVAGAPALVAGFVVVSRSGVASAGIESAAQSVILPRVQAGG